MGGDTVPRHPTFWLCPHSLHSVPKVEQRYTPTFHTKHILLGGDQTEWAGLGEGSRNSAHCVNGGCYRPVMTSCLLVERPGSGVEGWGGVRRIWSEPAQPPLCDLGTSASLRHFTPHLVCSGNRLLTPLSTDPGRLAEDNFCTF